MDTATVIRRAQTLFLNSANSQFTSETQNLAEYLKSDWLSHYKILDLCTPTISVLLCYVTRNPCAVNGIILLSNSNAAHMDHQVY